MIEDIIAQCMTKLDHVAKEIEETHIRLDETEARLDAIEKGIDRIISLLPKPPNEPPT